MVEVASLKPHEVGVRRIQMERGAERPLPVTVWYPAQEAGNDTPVSLGRFPIVVLSHGLNGQPEGFSGLAEPLARAGFVVAAPAYPHTRKGAGRFDRNDVSNQPADAMHVLNGIAELHSRADDPFAGRLNPARMCAAGFSAGGHTTAGMFTTTRDPRLRCGIVISGTVTIDGSFTGRPAPILFLHGDADDVVKYARGRTVYDNLTWPKAFITMQRQGHGEFLDPKRPGFAPAGAAILDFLRWNLYRDNAARQRLPISGALPGVASFDDKL
jgi:dienelactone hydrolase